MPYGIIKVVNLNLLQLLTNHSKRVSIILLRGEFMANDTKLILELCKRHGIKLQDEKVEGEFKIVADATTIRRVAKDYCLKEGEFFVTEQTAGALLLREPVVLGYTPQEIQETIDQCHYELTQEDLNDIKQK